MATKATELAQFSRDIVYDEVNKTISGISASLADTAVTPGSYGSSTAIPVITVDAKGRITLASTIAIDGLPTQTGNSGKYLTTNGTAASWDTLTTDDVGEGSNLYYTDARARLSVSATDSGGDGSFSYNNSTGVFTYTGPSATEVRAHFSASTGITITNGAIATTITQYTDALARVSVSVTDSGGDGSLSYDNTTGVFTYTGPSATEVRAHFSAGTGVTITNGQIAIGQAVATTSNVTFADISATGNVQIDGNLTVSGTTVTVNATNLAVEDNMIYLNNGSAVTNPDLGITGNYNDGTYKHAGFFRDASDGYWKVFKDYTLEPDASAFIDTSHASFALADIQAANFRGTLIGSISNALTIGTGLSGTSYNGSSAVTITIDSTVATLTGSQTLTNKTINLSSNTLSATSAQIAAAVSDETGSGALVFATSPSFTTDIRTPKVTTNGATNLVLDTNTGTTTGSITIAAGANGNISLVPNGTGTVVMGTSSSGTITTSGASSNLTLSTNGGTNSGTIVITAGANGNITLTPNGTGVVSSTNLVLGASSTTVFSGLFPATLAVISNGNTDSIIAKTDPSATNAGAGVFHQSTASPGFDAFRISTASTSSSQAALNILNGVNNSTGLGGTSIFYVRQDGNVGIGTSNPSSNIHVEGSTNTYLRLRNSNVAKSLYLAAENDSRVGIYAQGDSGEATDFFIDNGPGEALTILANGNIGIGNSSPSFKLDVAGGDDTNSFRVYGNSTYGPSVRIQYTGTDGRAWNLISNAAGNAGGAGALQFWNSTDSVTPMVIKPNGRIGVGTLDPNTIFEVAHTGQPPTSNSLYASAILSTDSTTNYQRLRYDVGSTPYWGLTREGSTNNFTLSGRISSTWSDTVLVVRQTDGNVGINNASPTGKLHIVGGGSSQLKVEGSEADLWLVSTGGGSGTWRLLGSTGNTTKLFRIYDDNSAADRLTINGDGFVGIGILQADYRFHVKTSSSGTAIAKFEGTTGRYVYTGTDGLGQYIEQVGTTDAERVLRVQSGNGSGSYVQLFFDGANGKLYTAGAKVGIGTSDFSYTQTDNTPLVGSKTDNRLFVNGSIQLLSNNDAIVIGRSSSSFFKDEEIGFGWGSGWYMTDSTYLRVRNYDSTQLLTGHVVPGTNATYDLGSSSLTWRNIYTNDLHLSNENHEKGNDVDGTKGNWTIQEGEDHLYIINNKSGKKYRFELREIE